MAYPSINFFNKTKKSPCLVGNEVLSCLAAAAKLAETIRKKGLLGAKEDTKQAALHKLEARLKKAQTLCEDELSNL